MESQIELSFRKEYPSLTIEAEFRFVRGFNVILGASGCGKTTTLRVMCGFEMPNRGFMSCCGEVFLDTERNYFLPPQRRKMGVVFQENNLLPNMTVRENIEFAVSKSGADVNVDQLIERFNLKRIENSKPTQISGGERQRVAIVRAIAYRPRALLMDEPFSSLDFSIKLKIINFLKELNLDIPVVLVTHDPIEANLLADRVFLMDRGRKLTEGGKELLREYFVDIDKLIYSS